MSKRRLLQLVEEGYVSGWDDPRMPTLSGLRRRGYTPEAIRDFMSRIGVAKTDSMVDVALLEHCLREDLNKRANRVMAVLRPLKLIVENWEESRVEELEAVNNPEDPAAGTRKVAFTRELWIERDDFQETPPPKYFRLFPGNAVRLRYGYIVTCTGFDKDPATGEVTAVRCTYDPDTKGGNAGDGKKVKGTIHWVSAARAQPIQVRLYDYLFAVDRPMDVEPGKSFLDNLNPQSLETLERAYAEPCLADAPVGARFQFERMGYFVRDPDTAAGKPVFNRAVGLRDTWAKIEQKS
jgi:glutaminyl-tRNA synthetase